MAITLTFEDFDTVCYSNQHNIIELINSSVGLAIQINLNETNITAVQNQANQLQQQQNQIQTDIANIDNELGQISSNIENIGDQAQEGHDALLLAQNLNVRLSSTEGAVKHIQDYDSTFLNTTQFGEQMKEVFRELDALNKEVFG